MSESLFQIPAAPLVSVKGEAARYPVHRIFCVGRNYAAHAAEMGAEIDREAPFYFTKPATAVVASGAQIAYPPGTENYHYEMELVVALGANAFRASLAEAKRAIYGYAAGLDMTRRDLQQNARVKQLPWDFGKAFEQSAIIAEITKADALAELGPRRISLKLDGALKQDARLSDMVWSAPELIAHLSCYYHLAPGDLIYTGTPAGVGALAPGNVIYGEIEGLAPVHLTILAPE